MSFDTIDLLDGNVFQVTWDLGRRCNYDCSYCPSHRHDNFSPHASLEELKNSAEFVFEYIDLYMQHRYYKFASIGFTGGEPTVNPNFIEFVKYFKQLYNEKYKDRYECSFSLTSNGAMSKKMADNVIEHFNHITVSYHAEADKKLKTQVVDRIRQFSKYGPENGCSVSTNVMFHAEYFDECVELCQQLDQEGIKYVPRVIGEEPDSKPTFAHKYSPEQLQWMKDYWNKDTKKVNGEGVKKENKDEEPKEKELGLKIGRPCCGSRTMCLSNNGEERKSKFVDFREFQGWNCSVNWFFMHIEQQTDQVFHHQTCQARFDQTRGSIGKLSEGYKILNDLKQHFANKTMPTIICPKHTCGCGLCAPKSKFEDKYKQVIYNHVDSSVFENAVNSNKKLIPIISI